MRSPVAGISNRSPPRVGQRVGRSAVALVDELAVLEANCAWPKAASEIRPPWLFACRIEIQLRLFAGSSTMVRWRIAGKPTLASEPGIEKDTSGSFTL